MIPLSCERRNLVCLRLPCAQDEFLAKCVPHGVVTFTFSKTKTAEDDKELKLQARPTSRFLGLPSNDPSMSLSSTAHLFAPRSVES